MAYVSTGTHPSGQQPERGASGQIADVPAVWPVESSQERYRGPVFGLRSDRVEMPDGPDGGTVVAARDYLVHPGAAAVLALDDQDRVLLQRQYRHAVRHKLWELPAGMLDVQDEPPVATARRELVEEAGLHARIWHELPSILPSPGVTDEVVHLFLARGLSRVPEEENGFVRRHEEADLVAAWVPLEEAVGLVMQGHVRNGITVAGILAARTAAQDGFADDLPDVSER